MSSSVATAPPAHSAGASPTHPPDALTPRFGRRSWELALALAAVLALVYALLAPPAGDLAAATYRSDLFARAGFTVWDTGWYAAHGYWLPSYSLLSPALGALLGVRTLLVLSALAASVLFALIAETLFLRSSARAAALCFALGVCVGMLSGRVPYDLGVAIGLGSALAFLRGRLALALVLALLASTASPVAGSFLALAALAGALVSAGAVRHAGPPAPAGGRLGALASNGPVRRAGLLAAAALAPIAALSAAYPNGGYEPFAASAFWPPLVAVLLISLLLPAGSLGERGRAVARTGALLYALALIAAYAIHTPMGGNAARLGPLLAPPLLVGVLWESHRRTLALLALPLLYWQLATPVRDYAALASNPSVNASYYQPLLAELRRLDGGRPAIVEVPMTKSHWESAYLAGHDGVRLARGWERQLDTRYAAVFYESKLSPADYRAWLHANRVRYVALPDAPLDAAGVREGALVARGVPYLRELWRSQHWRVYLFMG